MRKYLAAVIQMATGPDKEKNLSAACGFIDEAASRGAKLVALPEVFNVIDYGEEPPEEIPAGRTIQLMMQKAREHNIWLHCGSIAEANIAGGKKFNTSVVLNPKGEIVAKYRKLHMCDITLPNGHMASESAHFESGKKIVTVDTELGRFGLSICYDIRFPELYRLLALRGAQVIFTPADFVLGTGKDHWEAILRTRAIENACYILAPDQIGLKRGGRSTSFGDSIIIDPWGMIIARSSERAGIAVAEIDLDYEDKVRAMLPSLANRRADVYDVVEK